MMLTFSIPRLSLTFFTAALLCAAGPAAVHAQEAQARETVAATTAKVSDLAGTFTDFQLNKTANGRYKIAGRLTLTNDGATAKNVRANFYLSTDSEVDPEDLVHTMNLADYNGGVGKLKRGQQVELELKQKVVSFVGSLLDGQFLLIELVSDNNVAGSKRNVIVVGPISVPK